MKLPPALRRMLLGGALAALCTALPAATYYVDATHGNDTNNGTSAATAWRTLTKVNSIASFNAGDSILFERGEQWSGQLMPKGAGASGAPIVIDAYGSAALPPPLFKGNGATYSTLHFLNQPHWELRNIEVTNTGATLADRVGIYIGAHDFGQLNHVHLIDVIVHDVNGDDSAPNGANGGVFFAITGSTTPTWFNDILIDGCYVYNCAQRGITGPYPHWDDRTQTTNSNWTPSTNVIIRNSLFEHCRRQGLVWRVATGTLIEHNIFANCSDGAHGNAMFVFNADNSIIQMNESYGTRFEEGEEAQDAAGIDIDFRTKGTIVQYNYSHDNGEGGILCTGGEVGFNMNSIIRYNILQNNRRWGIHFSGGMTNARVYNNTIHISSILPEPVSIFHFGAWGGWPDGTKFYNNIVANYSYGATYDFGSSTNNVFDYNTFFDANDPATNEPADAHKSTADPLLVAPGTGGYGWDTVDGYKLKTSSPALGSGLLMSSNGGRDYFGNAVSSSTAPNRGAYQGAGVSQVAAPSFSPVGGTFSSAQTVTIATSTSGATIYYTTNGRTPSPLQGTLYSGPVTISSTAQLQAVAVKSGLAASGVTSAPFIIPVGSSVVLEAENLTRTTGGLTAANLSDAQFSGGAGVSLSTSDSPEWVEFVTPSIPAGTYDFAFRYKGYASRRQHYITLDGVDIGDTIDQYSAGTTFNDVHLGRVVFASAGTHRIRLVTRGHNPAATPTIVNGVDVFSLTADAFTFTAPPPSAMEAEDLARTVSGATASAGPDAEASGQKLVVFGSDGVNDYIEFSTQHLLAGTYALKLAFKGYTSRGRATVKVDGVTVGGTIEQYSATSTYPTVDVGNVTFGSAGTHTVRLTVSGKHASSSGYSLSADRIVFAKPATLLEAESLARTSSGAVSAVNSDVAASGGQQVVLSSDGTGDYVQFTTGSLPAGAYDLKLAYKAYNTRGRVQVTVDGVAVGDEVDQYSAAAAYTTTTIGRVGFATAGTHTVRLTVTGKSASSSDYTASADLLTFVPR